MYFMCASVVGVYSVPPTAPSKLRVSGYIISSTMHGDPLPNTMHGDPLPNTMHGDIRT